MALIAPNQMQALVLHQSQPVGKRFAAEGALVGFPAAVGALVLVKVQRGAEAAAAVGADVCTGDVGGGVGAVGTLVSVEVGTAAKALAALVARVRLLARVDA